VRLTAVDITRQIANAHTILNVGITLLFLPFANKFAQFVERLIPEKTAAMPDLERPEYLKQPSLETPIIALEQVRAETGRVAQMVQEMTRSLSGLLADHDEDLIARINQLEAGVDSLYREILDFLTKIARHNLTEQQSQENVLWIQTINDLEHMGDTLIRMQEAVRKKFESQATFSVEGEQELQAFFADVIYLTENLVLAIEKPEKNNIEQVAQQATKIITREQALRLSHIRRLHAQIAVTRDTSPIHLDLTNGMRRLAEHALLIANNLSRVMDDTHEEYLVQTYGEAIEAH
jgi:phosphate:Na+ symporter